MGLSNPFPDLPLQYLFDNLLPDFVLAFTFFTALCYAVLGRHFGQQRPAVAMSGTLGLAMAIGLVWWEHEQGWSVRDLGPVAIGFAVIMLAMVMYKAIRQTGGSWAGAGIAIGASILVAWILGIDWPVDREIIQSLVAVALTVGILAFLLHVRGSGTSGHMISAPRRKEIAAVRHDMSDLYRDRRFGKRLRKGLHHLKERTELLPEHPQESQDVMTTLQKMLPAEGYLTQRMAQLREKAHLVRKGHVARIEKIQPLLNKMPPGAQKKASAELAARYGELKLDLRLERLDKAVASYEKRIRDLTRLAESHLASRDYRKLHDVLEEAEKLQAHNVKLFKIIERTEKKLLQAAEIAAKSASGVSGA